MNDIYNPGRLADLKAHLEIIMGQPDDADEENKDFGAGEYMQDLVVELFFACHPHLSSTLNISVGESRFLYKLLARSRELRITQLDMQGSVSGTLNDRIELLNPGKAIVSALAFQQAIPPKKRFEAVMVESALDYLKLATDKKGMLRKLFNVLIPGGSLWIINNMAVNGSSDKSLNGSAQYISYLSKISSVNRKRPMRDLSNNRLNYGLYYLFTDLKNIGFHRVELIYKHFGSIAMVAMK